MLEREALIALLDFHVAAGIDIALDEAPHNRFAEQAASERRREAPSPPGEPARQGLEGTAPERLPAPRALPPAAIAPLDEIAENARAVARGARNLDELRAVVEAFEGCALKRTARQAVFGHGNPAADLMVIGAAPGDEEERSARAFDGKAGTLLDGMLASIGLNRDSVYATHFLPWRPPGNRPITPHELAGSLPFLWRTIELVQPRLILALGEESTRALTGARQPIAKLRGRLNAITLDSGASLALLPTIGLRQLISERMHKRLAWRDLRLLRRTLDGGGSQS